jgi:hypothetical protein
MASRKAPSFCVSAKFLSLTDEPGGGIKQDRASFLPPVKTAIYEAFLIYSIAFVISMLVALLIKWLFKALRSISDKS